MRYLSLALAILMSSAFAGCAGGASGGGMTRYGVPPVPSPSVAPTTPPTPSPQPSPTPATVLGTHNINGGAAFVTAQGFAVYVSDGDTTPNVSNCNAGCAAIWPPVAPPTNHLPAPWAQFKRSDGTEQLSYKGKPLYTFVNDTQPFVATGDGVNGFHLARP